MHNNNYNHLNTELEQTIDYTLDLEESKTNIFKNDNTDIDFQDRSVRTISFKQNDLTGSNFYEQNSRVNLLKNDLTKSDLDQDNRTNLRKSDYTDIDFRAKVGNSNLFKRNDTTELEFHEHNSKAKLLKNNILEDTYREKNSQADLFRQSSQSDSGSEPISLSELLNQGTATNVLSQEPQNNPKDNVIMDSDMQLVLDSISSYKPEKIDLPTELKIFVPDYIPYAGTVDAMLRPKRPDGKPETIGIEKDTEGNKGSRSVVGNMRDRKDESKEPNKIKQVQFELYKNEKEKARFNFNNLFDADVLKELENTIKAYTPKEYKLETHLKAFIPDYIPYAGDLDAFLKPPRPDGQEEHLGLTIIDEPCLSSK